MDKIREYGKDIGDGKIAISPEDTEELEKFSNDMSQILESEISLNIELLKPSENF